MKPEQATAADEALARHFSTMRAEDSHRAPSFSAPAAPLTDVSQPVRYPGGVMGGAAIAASLILALGVWFSLSPAPEDPAQLYAAVMDNYQLTTDDLLQVSDGTLPELVDLPELLAPSSTKDMSEVLN